VYSKLYPLAVAVNSINSSDTDFSFDIQEYLTIDGAVSLHTIARENICANCGTFEGTVPLGTFVFGHRQHFRESLFTQTNDSVRKGKILVCTICHLEALLNSLLCGITVENQRSRINRKTHLILYGLDINKDLLQQLTDKKLVERLLKDFRITGENVYVTNNQDLHIVFFSLEESSIGISNQVMKELLFSLIINQIKIQNPLVYAFGVNMLPDIMDSSLIQYKEGIKPCIEGTSLDFFYYVVVHVSGNLDRKRDYILKYHANPLIGIAQIFKRENTRYTAETHEVVMKLEAGDFKYEIMDKIWEMAKYGGSLETGKNVGSFLGVFRATPEDVDRIVNKFMKNEKLSKETRGRILEIHESVREELKTLNEDQRKKLKDYAQKTKYLFNSKKFHELGKGGDKNE
jgi:DNA-directed RNA polymerase subunit F